MLDLSLDTGWWREVFQQSGHVYQWEFFVNIHETQQCTEIRPARLIAVGNQIHLQAAVTEHSFSAELERIVNLAVPHLAIDRPNLVALGEFLGLPLAITGRRGYLSRYMHTANVAISMLALGYTRRMLHYRRLYPGISLVRSLFLSLSDVLYRPFESTLSRVAAKHSIYLSDSEKATFDLTPGELDSAQAFETEIGKIGMAISLDAFAPEYLQKLDSLGASIVIQNDARDLPWAGPSRTCEWQPQEQLNSVLGSLQDDYPHLSFNICPMQVGNFFDVTFDGQSTIPRKSDNEPDPYCNFVGNDSFVHTMTGKAMTGDILAISPWVEEDLIKSKAKIALAERRSALEQVARQLLPGGV